MTSAYHIHEVSNGLRINVERHLGTRERLLAASFAGIIVAVAAGFSVSHWWWTVLATVAAVITFIIVRGQNVQLRVTNVELVATRDLGRRVRTRVVCMADIRRMEFQEPALMPGGLYAITARKEYCVLPFVSYTQTQEIIRAIETTFPGLAEMWHKEALPRSRVSVPY